MERRLPVDSTVWRFVADLFGVSVRRIQQLTQEGVLPTTDTPDGRRYDLVPTVQKYTAYLSDKAYGRSKTDKEAELKEQKLRAEIAPEKQSGRAAQAENGH